MSPWPNFSVSTFWPRADWELGSWKPAAPRCSATPAPNTAATIVNSTTAKSTRLGAAITTGLASKAHSGLYGSARHPIRTLLANVMFHGRVKFGNSGSASMEIFRLASAYCGQAAVTAS